MGVDLLFATFYEILQERDEQKGVAGMQAEIGRNEGSPAAGCWLGSHDWEGVLPQPDISSGLNRATIHVKETWYSKEIKT